LLEGVPFAHLIPDSELLPPESIRFFYLDREWTDALVQGALSVGTVNSLDRQHLQGLHARIRDEVDAEERKVRTVGADVPGAAAAETITGFLLRSRLVSGWPALHVRGYRQEIGPDDGKVDENDPRRLRLVRLGGSHRRCSCVCSTACRRSCTSKSRARNQFGVDLVTNGDGVTRRGRSAATFSSTRLDKVMPAPAGETVAHVPFRQGAPGVIDVQTLAQRIAAQPATHVNAFGGPGVGSAELAMEMLQFPFRQVFGDPRQGTRPGAVVLEFIDLFKPQIKIAMVREWEQGGHR
jgi:hypothetical protein